MVEGPGLKSVTSTTDKANYVAPGLEPGTIEAIHFLFQCEKMPVGRSLFAAKSKRRPSGPGVETQRILTRESGR